MCDHEFDKEYSVLIDHANKYAALCNDQIDEIAAI